MRIIVAECSAVYSGRLDAMLPRAKRVILIKADSSVLIFSELGSYKPLNWMAAPCTLRDYGPDSERWDSLVRDTYVDDDPDDAPAGVEMVCPGSEQASRTDGDDAADGAAAPGDADGTDGSSASPSGSEPVKFLRAVADKGPDILTIAIYAVYSDQDFDLGTDPGLVKDGVEDHLQNFLSKQIDRIGKGAKLIRREFPTAIGPVDIMAEDSEGVHVAIEIKRHGGVDGVEQLTRYCTLLNRDPLLAPVRGIFAAQTITPQAQVLAKERGFECMILDYYDMKRRNDEDIDDLQLF